MHTSAVQATKFDCILTRSNIRRRIKKLLQERLWNILDATSVAAC